MKNFIFLIKKYLNIDNRGITIIETLFAAALVATFMGVLSAALILYFQTSITVPKYTAAVFLADEGIEAVRTIRNEGWDSEIEVLNNDVFYHLYFSDGRWNATTTEQAIDETFTRTFVLREVERDVGGRITETGTVNNDTRLVEVAVEWDGLIGKSDVEISAYIVNIFD